MTTPLPKIPKFFGLTPKDATEPLLFPVRRRHVVNAVPRDPEHCVIALALSSKSAKVRPVRAWNVGALIVHIVFGDEPGVVYRYQISQKSMGLTRLFDTSEEEIKRNPQLVAGKVIQLNPPSPTKKIGYRRGKSGTNVRGTGVAKSRAPRTR